MKDGIKADEIALIWKKMNECKKYLKQKDVYLALVSFKEALEKRMTTAMLASDQKELDKDISSFQQELFGSKAFRDVYGPVSFQDNENATLLPFILQLIKAQDQSLMETVQHQIAPDQDFETGSEAEVEKKAQIIMDLLERGDLSGAKRLLSKDDDVSVYVANTYNTSGISSRIKGEFDKSIGEYLKALVALPEDEGLFYNIARAHIEKGEWDEAVEAIKNALRINPEFKEGNDLMRFIIHMKAEKRGLDKTRF